MEANIVAPNREYLEFTYVKDTITGKGLNNQLIMQNMHDGTFTVTEGRIGIKVGVHKPRRYLPMPIDQWNDYYAKVIKKGYFLLSEKKRDSIRVKRDAQAVNGEYYKKIEEPSVKDIVDTLMAYTNQLMEESLTMKVDFLSDEILNFGKEILDDMAIHYQHMSVAEFNGKLKKLYSVIPRKIENLSKKLAVRNIDIPEIIAQEQELYDIVYSQIHQKSMLISNEQTILDAFGLTWREVTEEEKSNIIKHLGCEASRFSRAWRIQNTKTEDAFVAYCKKENLTEDNKGISHLFHGSRSENFWSIITNGLTINPVGVVITGKAFGNGTYFAPNATKSMGYTSRLGSKWANGNNVSGYMGIYKVATGKRYDPPSVDQTLTWNILQKKCPGAHCTWASARNSGFCMDEVIVYQDCQSTIEYFVEMK